MNYFRQIIKPFTNTIAPPNRFRVGTPSGKILIDFPPDRKTSPKGRDGQDGEKLGPRKKRKSWKKVYSSSHDRARPDFQEAGTAKLNPDFSLAVIGKVTRRFCGEKSPRIDTVSERQFPVSAVYLSKVKFI